jgi:DMSO/TMAO reductase YedYZ molybdopterin-dependent catalytic subunit
MLGLLTAALALGQPSDVPLRLDGLERQTVDWQDHGKARRCEGVRLADVLGRAGAPAGDAVRGPALSTLVVVEAEDGYRVIFSLGELDAKLGNGKLLLVDRCDGQTLGDGEGPLRLVAPGEARGARSVRQLRTIRLVPLID